MKLSYDRFIDTKEKRLHLIAVICLLVALIFFLPYVYAGIILMRTTSYASIFSLLHQPLLSMCYIIRIIMDCLSLDSFHLARVIYIIWDQFGILEFLMLVSCLLAGNIIIRHKYIVMHVIVLLIETLLPCLLLLYGLQAVSLNEAMTYIRMIGIIFIICNSWFVIMIFISLRKQLKKYHKALAYDIVEIKEHVV